MLRIYLCTSLLLIVVAIVNSWHHAEEGEARVMTLEEIESREPLDWFPLLNGVKQFEKVEVIQDVVETEPEIVVRSPDEAVLTGILQGDEPFVSIILPDSLEVINLKMGEGWLEDWTLRDISKDFVIWENVNTLSTLKQDLF